MYLYMYVHKLFSFFMYDYACCVVSSFSLLNIYDNMFLFFSETHIFISLLLDKTVHFKK